MTPIIRAVGISATCSHLQRSAWQFRCISKMELLEKESESCLIIGIVSGVLASLVSVLDPAKLFSLSHEQYVTLLPKSITIKHRNGRF